MNAMHEIRRLPVSVECEALFKRPSQGVIRSVVVVGAGITAASITNHLTLLGRDRSADSQRDLGVLADLAG